MLAALLSPIIVGVLCRRSDVLLHPVRADRLITGESLPDNETGVRRDQSIHSHPTTTNNQGYLASNRISDVVSPLNQGTVQFNSFYTNCFVTVGI